MMWSLIVYSLAAPGQGYASSPAFYPHNFYTQKACLDAATSVVNGLNSTPNRIVMGATCFEVDLKKPEKIPADDGVTMSVPILPPTPAVPQPKIKTEPNAESPT